MTDSHFDTPLETAAAQLHEMFTTLLAAGFDEPQALMLTSTALQKMMDKED